MAKEYTLACVGKPSVGKSSTINSLTKNESLFKIGNYPFTTLTAQEGVSYIPFKCKCKNNPKCKPTYGKCDEGKRYIPIKVLDIPGLIPEAHLNLGLGNKFLDSLRTADLLIHCIDISGTTNAKGESTRGYDPINDVEFLINEIKLWIYNNLEKKWGSIVRRHINTNSSIVETLTNQLAGYSANMSMVQKTVDLLMHKQEDEAESKYLPPLDKWDEELILKCIECFMEIKFPMILALNKIDHPDANKNISKLVLKYQGKYEIVLTTAITEIFLQKLHTQGFINYESGTEFLDTFEDDPDNLKELPPTIIEKIEKIRDLILFRYGSTGIQDLLITSAKVLDLLPVYTVKNINNLDDADGNCYKDAFLIKNGSTVGDVKKHLFGIDVSIGSILTTVGIRVSEEDIITKGKNDVLCFKLAPK